MKRLVVFFALMIVLADVFAQLKTSKIHVIARPADRKVLLRWAPDNDVAWQYLVKQGVIIERYTVSRDQQLVSPAEKRVLTQIPFKPLPAEAWALRVDSSDHHAIAAQALYGDDFAVTNQKSNNVMEMITVSKQQELRYSFLLFAADQSFNVARSSGLGWEDTSIRPGERYLYRVYAAAKTPVRIDTGFVYVNPGERFELPPPLDVHGTFGDKMVTLRWNKRYHENIYTSYRVERSEDGTTFKPINDLPFVMAEPRANESASEIFRIDSLSENNKTYYYRVRGKNAFGEIGPPSDVVSGAGIDKLSFQIMLKADVVQNKEVSLNWSVYPPERMADIIGFSVHRSSGVTGDYKTIYKEGKPPRFVDSSPGSTNYYMVTATTRTNQIIKSFPVLAQLEDSIPPISPEVVVGTVDTVGIVTLSWRANTEEDLLGYRVYRSNYKSAEFSQITRSPVGEIKYTDTINIRTLDKRVYYKITAIDKRFNESAFSKVLELARPDRIAPVPPVFTSVLNEKDHISLAWKASSSDDVKEFVLYRKAGRDAWQKLQTLSKDSIAYRDNRIVPNTNYQYKILAADDAGNISDAAKVVTVRSQVSEDHIPLDQITATADRERKVISLGWQYPQWNSIQKFYLFRSANGEPMSLYKSIPAGSRTFFDNEIKMSSRYQYRMKVVFKDGSETQFSKEVNVDY